ncbi:MAG: glycosyltransferase family 4 protein, partial [Nitrososphaera sp.]|nr:glycosyltransferase family 4 protein [Nitrososphaera sp.]
DAGSLAAIQEMRLLQSLGCKLTFVPLNVAYLGGYTDTLQRMGVECVYAPFATSAHEVIQRRGAEFDLVYITRYVVAEQVLDQLHVHAPQAKVMLCNADLHFLRELRAALGSNSHEQLVQAIRIREAELAVMRKVDLVLSYNEVEHSVIISHNLDSTKVAKAPWVVALPETVPVYSQRKDIAFLGGFGHPPNKEAVEFFVREVMPLLKQQLPDVCFLVYGSDIPKELFDVEKDDDRVLVKGWVADVAEVYDTCRIFVAPLLSGAGLKGKVVDALAHGVPTILSPVAAEGIGLRDGLETRIVREPKEWVDAIVDLYKSEKTWSAMSAAARQFAKTEYGAEKGKQLMCKAMEMVGLYPDTHE